MNTASGDRSVQRATSFFVLFYLSTNFQRLYRSFITAAEITTDKETRSESNFTKD